MPIRPPQRAAGRALVPWALGALALLVVAGGALAVRHARSIPISLQLDAVDASGSPVAAAVRLDGSYIGDTPLVLVNWWDFDAADLVEPSGPVDETVPPGTTRFYDIDSTVGDVELTTVSLVQPDGAVVVRLRAERGGRAVDRTLRIEVGDPGALLRPSLGVREGGLKGFMGATSYRLRFEFSPGP